MRGIHTLKHTHAKTAKQNVTEDKQTKHGEKRRPIYTQVCVCSYKECAEDIMPVEFLYGEHEAGLLIKQGFYSFWSLVLGPKDC